MHTERSTAIHSKLNMAKLSVKNEEKPAKQRSRSMVILLSIPNPTSLNLSLNIIKKSSDKIRKEPLCYWLLYFSDSQFGYNNNERLESALFTMKQYIPFFVWCLKTNFVFRTRRAGWTIQFWLFKGKYVFLIRSTEPEIVCTTHVSMA